MRSAAERLAGSCGGRAVGASWSDRAAFIVPATVVRIGCGFVRRADDLASAARMIVLRARSDEPGLVCVDDGLDAVADVELLEDVRDVGLDRRLAEDERCGDFGVRGAAGEMA